VLADSDCKKADGQRLRNIANVFLRAKPNPLTQYVERPDSGSVLADGRTKNKNWH